MEIWNHVRKFHVEVLPPKQDVDDLEDRLEKFAEKYRRVIEAGYCACITDNAMGNLSFQATELITELGLPVDPENVMIHLNTFHTKRNLDEILDTAIELGVRYLLVVSGDGSPRLPKLRPDDIGCDGNESVTSVELLEYIEREYPDKFILGVAFNPYEPQEHEFSKLENKIRAGAKFVITQPIIERNEIIDRLIANFNIPIVVEAWMSKKLYLLSECVGYEIPEDAEYDPVGNLEALLKNYPGSGVYLALLNYKRQFGLLEDLKIKYLIGDRGVKV